VTEISDAFSVKMSEMGSGDFSLRLPLKADPYAGAGKWSAVVADETTMTGSATIRHIKTENLTRRTWCFTETSETSV